ncbi:MAG TPA: acyl-CoA dehydrogenase family protein [Ferrovibrio sp.]|uniref:acyl-CoA dehydrogenase family protein n=1 Tax=Ferrovibrio sp. TaxID=1917215 RepID=UPI002ED3C734
MQLTEEQKQIRDVARRFARERLAPFARRREQQHGGAARELLAELGRIGLMGVLIDPEYGGAGAGYVALSQVLMEIGAGDGGCSTMLSVHNSLVTMGIQKFGSEEQKRAHLPAMARGEMLGAFCLTEPDAGSDAAAIRTSARRKGNRFVLNGSKQFITSGKSADVALIFAVTDPKAGKKGLSAFLVPTNAPGYRAARIEETMGQQAFDHCHVVLDDCAVEPGQMLGEEGAGLNIALSNLEGGRIGVGAQAIGMARAAYEIALRYAKERRSFGKPIIEHQAVGFRLADMATRLQAAELMVWHAASLRDAGVPCLKEASMAKLFATEVAERVAHDAIQTLGGYGYLREYEVERIYRDVRVCEIYEGTSDIQRLVISRQLMAAE